MTCDEIYTRIALMVRRLMASSTIETVTANALLLIEKAVGGELKDESKAVLTETIRTTPLSLIRIGLLTVLGGVMGAMMRPIEARAWQAYFMARSESEAYAETGGPGDEGYQPEEFGEEWYGCEDEDSNDEDQGPPWLN